MNSNIKPQNRTNDILTQKLVGEVMIYDLQVNKAFLLNPTSSLIWQFCDGTKSISEIARLVSEELDEAVPEDLVWLALDQLDSRNLLDKKGGRKSNFLEMSRREVVRRVGLTSMVALPVISSIVVPNAVDGATTCIPDQGLCAVPTDCCSRCCADVSDGAAICAPLEMGICFVA